MAKRAAQGAGTIRKKTVTRNGKEYTYWEARITIGRDPGTGKQVQRSFSGKTQKEVREKMQAAAHEVNTGTYIPPAKMTVGQWLDTWQAEYLGSLKPSTCVVYRGNIRNHIKPYIGAVGLSDLHPHIVQKYINGLNGLSPASIRLAYKVLHMALEKAVSLDYIPKNPASRCVLPKAKTPAIYPLDDQQAAAVLAASKGTEIQHIVSVALFTGMRQGELLGMTWDCVDFKRHMITVEKQLAKKTHGTDDMFIAPKNGNTRIITVAPFVISTLQTVRTEQKKMRLKAGDIWDNPHNLVFTQADGSPFTHNRASNEFRRVRLAAGLENTRFHDLRHTYAVNAIRAGDDIKTIQGNLGHASAAFTLDRYGHFTERMKQDSASRMQAFITDNLNL